MSVLYNQILLQALVEEGLLLIHEEIRGKMGERQIERRASEAESI